MNFKNWMRNTNLSESSIKKYSGAIEGVLTKWAFDASLIQGSILDITNKTIFDNIAVKIQKSEIFKERNNTGHSMYSNALNKYSNYLEKGAVPKIDEDIEEIISNKIIAETEKTRLISARVGQGQYRKDLLKLWENCAVTGYSKNSMLVASHIKPWAHSTHFERLDKYNGLLLTPSLDKAFDQGLITFSKSGHIKISPSFKNPDTLGIHKEMYISLNTENLEYLAYHQKMIYIKI